MAMAENKFDDELVPVEVPWRKADPLIVATDEHPRADTDFDKLARLPAPFRDGGTVTAGNASGANDGAGAILIASDATMASYGLEPSVRIAGAATAGVPPRIMGIGPALRKLLDCKVVALGDIGVIEVNEAFAAQVLAVTRELGLADDAEHVNPSGGAVAYGHPLGASGIRLVATATYEMRRRGERYGAVTMCIGVGRGIAALLERV